jgi:hypothetical protein
MFNFKKMLTEFSNPCIILYIDDAGQLLVESSADIGLTQDMLQAAAEFLPTAVDVEVSDGASEFVSKSNFH